jgi:hypothetical protein
LGVDEVEVVELDLVLSLADEVELPAVAAFSGSATADARSDAGAAAA